MKRKSTTKKKVTNKTLYRVSVAAVSIAMPRKQAEKLAADGRKRGVSVKIIKA